MEAATEDILAAVDRVLAEAARPTRHAATARDERRLARALRHAFDVQGKSAQRHLAALRPAFPADVAEALRPQDVEQFLDRVLGNTRRLFARAIQSAATAAVRTGAGRAFAALGVGGSFDLGNPRAVAFLRDHGAERVTLIEQATRDDLRAILVQAADEGWAYTKTAKVIGDRFAGFRRTKAGTQSRAELIARTEIGEAYEHGNLLAAQQLADDGHRVEKSWLTAGDSRVEAECRGNAGAGWIPVADAFPSGHQRPLAHPRCLPGETRVDASALLAATKRPYDGKVVIIHTAAGHKLTCTPNHPVLTPSGWIAAGRLDVGDQVISSLRRKWVTATNTDDHAMPPCIEEVVEAFGRSGDVAAEPVEVAAPDFHGDGLGSKVAVVWTDRELLGAGHAALSQKTDEVPLVLGRTSAGTLLRDRHAAELLEGDHSTARGAVGRLGVATVLGRRPGQHHQAVGFRGASAGDTGRVQAAIYAATGYSEAFRQLIDRGPGNVEANDLGIRQPFANAANFYPARAQTPRDGAHADAQGIADLLCTLAADVVADDVVNVERQRFKGHVFNLETVTGWYVAEGIVTHNCRCALTTRIVGGP